VPVKDPHTRIQPLALASGHGRYITVTFWPLHIYYNRYKFVTASLPKRFRNGRFNSETATWIQNYFKQSVGTSIKLYLIVFQGGDDGRGYGNMYKIPRGSHLKQGDRLLESSTYSIIVF
jgi:hypothetical protein